MGLPVKVKKPLTIVGDVRNRVCIIVEDIVDDATALVDAANLLKQTGGAIKVHILFKRSLGLG